MKFLTVFSDASFHESGAAGYAFYVRDDTTIIKEGFPVPWIANSSTEIEMFAMCHAILHALDYLPHEPGDVVVAQTDCEHVIRGFDLNCKTSEYEANMRDSVLSALRRSDIRLRWKHVKAHTGAKDVRSYVNQFCDTHAKIHMRQRRKVLDQKFISYVNELARKKDSKIPACQP